MEKVSIIMPTFNAERFIRKTLDCIYAQTHTNFEILVCDDGSTDETVGILETYRKEYGKMELIRSSSNKGAAAARNSALEIAHGRYAAFLDSDDLWKPEFLEKQIHFMEKKQAAFVFCSFHRIDEEDNIILEPLKAPEKVNYKYILKTNPMTPLSVLIDTKKVPPIHFPEEAVKREDLAAWLSLLKHIEFAYGNPEILALYRQRSNSVSRKKMEMMYYQYNVYRAVEKLSVPASLYYLINWAVRGYLKYRK